MKSDNTKPQATLAETTQLFSTWALDPRLIDWGAHTHLLAGILLAHGKVSDYWSPCAFGGRCFSGEDDPTQTAQSAIENLVSCGFLAMDPSYIEDLYPGQSQTYEIISPAYLTKGGDK